MRGDQEGTAVRGEPDEGRMDLAMLGRALWRRRRWIIIPTILVAIASAIVVSLLTPVYRAQTLLLIENRETAYNRPEGDRLGERDRMLLDAEAVQSQVQLALSRDLAREVVRELKLSERPEFNPNASASPLGDLLGLIGLSRGPARMTNEERILERYYDRLSVYQIERSRVIAIEFRSEDPDLAAQVANTIANSFLRLQQEAKAESMRDASRWLSREIDEMRKRVAEAEARVEDFRSKSNLYVGSNNNTLSAQQLGELNSQIVLANTQKAEAESKARLIREMLQGAGPIETSEIVNSELIRRLNEQRVTLQAQLAEQSSTLLPQHPRIKELRAQIADLDQQTRVEAAKLARSLENDSRVAGTRLETLMTNLDQLKQQAAALGGQDVQLRALEREAKSQRDLLESFLARYRDVTARDAPDAIPPDARIVSRAVAPSTPYFPRRLPIVLIATLATFVAAVSFIALGEILSGGLQPRAPVAMASVMPETLPPATKGSWIAAASNAVAPPRPESSVTGRERQLAALVEHLRGLGRGIVVVTGVGEQDPAPRVAVELARALGQEGARVLFLDLDVGAAPAANLVPDPRAPGLADLLFGVATFSEVIHRDPASRIHVIGTGRGVRDTASLLSAEKLAIVFGALSQTYEQVVVPAPALSSLPGADRLARFARGVVLVTSEGGEGAGAAASDTLGSLGFSNVVVVTVGPGTPLDTTPDRAAA